MHATTLLDDSGDNENNKDAVERDDYDACYANLVNDGKELVRLIEWNLTMSSVNSPFRNIAEVIEKYDFCFCFGYLKTISSYFYFTLFFIGYTKL